MASSAMRTITGLLAELHHTLSQPAEVSLGELEVQPLFDEGLKRSYTSPAAVAAMVEGEAGAGEAET